ncbi:MAG TPA: HNH endonuclease signature motif containing protein [Thermoleophilaceae bacterium]
MLREDKRARYIPQGAWFWKRYRFETGKLLGAPITSQALTAATQLQPLEPVFVFEHERRRWWWFKDRFYWDDDGLSVEDVFALLVERERRKRRQLERAHANLAQERAPSPRREPLPRELRLAVWERDGGRCVECEGDFELQFDHIIPVVLGGATSLENLQLLCAPCNRAKGGAL